MRFVQVSEVLEATLGPNKGRRFVMLTIVDDERADYISKSLDKDALTELIAKLKARLIRIDRIGD